MLYFNMMSHSTKVVSSFCYMYVLIGSLKTHDIQVEILFAEVQGPGQA